MLDIFERTSVQCTEILLVVLLNASVQQSRVKYCQQVQFENNKLNPKMKAWHNSLDILKE